MLDAATVVPSPVNEPIRQYAPGSGERSALEARLKELGVPQGQTIPRTKLAKAAGAKGQLGRRARFAKELEGFHKK